MVAAAVGEEAVTSAVVATSGEKMAWEDASLNTIRDYTYQEVDLFPRRDQRPHVTEFCCSCSHGCSHASPTNTRILSAERGCVDIINEASRHAILGCPFLIRLDDCSSR